MSNAASDISVRERDISRRFKKLREGEPRERKRDREKEGATNQVLYREKSSLLVRRKKPRLKILSWGGGTLLAATWKSGERELPPGKIEYEVNARNGNALRILVNFSHRL